MYQINLESMESVEFSCHAATAKAVFVAGTFNDWRPDATPLHNHLPDGRWAVTLPIPIGYHEYKFVVDGQWCCEPGCERAYNGCPKCCVNEFGTMNRVLEVR
jgi:1,4-alpha-glucan branching enzyme